MVGHNPPVPAFFFSFTWMVLRLPYILYYFQEFKQQSNSIVLGNYLYSSHIYSSQTIVKWVARIDGGIQKKVKEPQPKSAHACNPVFWRTGHARS
jgi:hypothetical protein